MDFLKKHYEKVLLGVMLAGLIGVLVFMLIYIASDREGMENKRTRLIGRVQPLTNLNLTAQETAIARLNAPYKLDFENRNRLLNPMDWQKDLGGNLVLVGTQTGLRMAVVTNITSLYLEIKLASASTNFGVARYNITVQHQGSAKPAQRVALSHFVSVGDKPKPDDPFTLLQAQGPPESPTALLLKLADSGDTVTINKDKAYQHVEAYAADIWYAPERKAFHNVRKGSHVPLGGLDYVVDEVTQNQVTLVDQSNQKKTSLQFNP